MADQHLIASEQITLDELRVQLEREPGSLFAILDACDEPRVPEKMGELGPRAVSLYKGDAERDYWAIAPYLAIVDRELLAWIVEHLWEHRWGVFAFAEPDLDALRQHFRHFLIVQDPQEKPMFFRFYDPRVLPVFLNSCSERELEAFYGPVRAYVVPENGGGLSAFKLPSSLRSRSAL